MPRRRTSWPARIGAPIAFLLAATAGVLLVRAALDADTSPVTPSPVTTTAPPAPISSTPRFYTVRPGDTLSLVAVRFDTTVERLLELNPGVDATDLVPGQELRIE
jgi:peptidoglycan endopeptidase LytE